MAANLEKLLRKIPAEANFALWRSANDTEWCCIVAPPTDSYWLEGYESGPECTDVSWGKTPVEALKKALAEYPRLKREREEFDKRFKAEHENSSGTGGVIVEKYD